MGKSRMEQGMGGGGATPLVFARVWKWLRIKGLQEGKNQEWGSD
jgi:hypothetical protein